MNNIIQDEYMILPYSKILMNQKFIFDEKEIYKLKKLSANYDRQQKNNLINSMENQALDIDYLDLINVTIVLKK